MAPGNSDRNPFPRHRDIEKGKGSTSPKDFKGARNVAGSGKPAGGVKPTGSTIKR